MATEIHNIGYETIGQNNDISQEYLGGYINLNSNKNDGSEKLGEVLLYGILFGLALAFIAFFLDSDKNK